MGRAKILSRDVGKNLICSCFFKMPLWRVVVVIFEVTRYFFSQATGLYRGPKTKEDARI